MRHKRAKAGQRSRTQKAADNATPQAQTAPPLTRELSPLDYALALMRDETQPAALRVSMAKAAIPYLHQRGAEAPLVDEPETPQWSDLELARRIAHILMRADDELGNPVEKPTKAGPSGAVPAKTG